MQQINYIRLMCKGSFTNAKLVLAWSYKKE